MVVHHHGGLQLVSMVSRFVEPILARQDGEPFARKDEEVRVIHSQVANHALESVASVTVDNQQLSEALMMQRGHRVGKDGSLSVVTIMDAELQVALPGVLCAHRNRRQHHGTDSKVIKSTMGSINGHIMSQDGVCKIRKMQVVGFCCAPRQDDYAVVERACNTVGRYTQVNLAVHNGIVLVLIYCFGSRFSLKGSGKRAS